MDNVYDLVEDFYGHDPGWNFLLRREYADGFLRTEAWQGKSPEELYDIWDQLTMLCLYLGNTELLLGDMSADDFVDCVAWCGRNVSEFEADYEHTKYFLETCGRLYAYLQKKKVISDAGAPLDAAAKLLDGGTMHIINPDGSFAEGHKARTRHTVPDAANKIFLNVGERMQEIYAAMHEFFTDTQFSVDLERATVLYHGVFGSALTESAKCREEAVNSFWDYFLMDYRLMLRDMHPLEYFYRAVCCKDGGRYDADFARRNSDILEEFLSARLVIFTVQGFTDEGAYLCRDFLSNETYQLNLPLNEDFDTTDMLFIGHIFYNGNMLTDNVRGYKIERVNTLFLRDTLKRTYEWVSVQQQKPTWQWFSASYPMVLRNMTFLYAAGIAHRNFNNYTEHTKYNAAPYRDDTLVAGLLKNTMLKNYFSVADVRLATQMWCDLEAAGAVNGSYSETEWTAGVIYTFIRLNGAYTFFDEHIAKFCGVEAEKMRTVAEYIAQALNVEEHDPRYSNEEGLLVMLMSAHM